MSLQNKLDAFKANLETNIAPPAMVEIFHRTTAELIATGQAQRALNVDDRAPSFSLPDAEGMLVSSEELLAKGPLVLTFYRGVWCPYCNFELQAIEDVAADIRSLGASIVAISPQSATNSRKTQRDNQLSFPVLSDLGSDIADAFGIRFRVPDELIPIYKSFGNDLPIINDEPSWTLAMAARYVIGTDGVIAYAEINPDYTRRPEPSELMPTLKRLQPAT
jgi:peroxiredoxin